MRPASAHGLQKIGDVDAVQVRIGAGSIGGIGGWFGGFELQWRSRKRMGNDLVGISVGAAMLIACGASKNGIKGPPALCRRRLACFAEPSPD